MKKILPLLLFFQALIVVYSFEKDEIGINIGVYGAGLSSDTGIGDGYFWGHFLNVEYYSKTGWGLHLSPLHFSTSIKHKEDGVLTFVNASVFYDFIQFSDCVFGPFAAVSAVNYSRPDFFEARSGLMFLLQTALPVNPRFTLNYFFVELGYAYNNTGKQQFYAQAGIDLIWIFALLGTGQTKDIEKYRTEHPGY